MTFELAAHYSLHGGDAPPNESLEIALRAILDAGRAAWPDVTLDPCAFVEHVAERTHGESAALDAIHATDLYLACACKLGDRAAIAIFARAHFARVPEFLARMRATPDLCDEVRQILGEKFFVSAPGSPAKIGEYSGRGSLAAWVRVAAVRVALDLRARRHEEPEEAGAEVEKILTAEMSPELDVLRRQFATEFKDALRAAFASLEPDQRLVLRLHLLKGKTGDEIASALHIHRATVVRWLSRARDDVQREATRYLQSHVRGSPSELESVIRLLRSHVDMSLSQLLGGETA